jgi:hypothetical protein
MRTLRVKALPKALEETLSVISPFIKFSLEKSGFR